MEATQTRDRSSAGPVRGRARISRVRRTTTRVLRSRADILAVIAVGGALGSLARWGIGEALPVRPGRFPWATLIANVSGCLLLGVLMVFVLDVWPPSRYARPFLGVGVLGGYTTFSTAMLDIHAQLVAGHAALAGSYLSASLGVGLVAVWVGMVLARATVVAVRSRARRRREPDDAGPPQAAPSARTPDDEPTPDGPTRDATPRSSR
jgi:CrcB protein